MEIVLLGLIFVTVLAVVVAATQRPGAERVQHRMAAITTAAPVTSIVEQELQRPFTERFLLPVWARIARVAMRLTPSGSAQAIQQMLDTAGNPPRLGVREFAVLRLVFAAAGTVGGVLLYLRLLHAGMPLPGLLFGGATLIGGWTLPASRLRAVGEQRKYRIRKSLPDIMDLLVVSVEAGLGFDGAIAKVVEKMEGPLPDEMRRVLDGMRLGNARAQALREMARRIQVTELNTFVGAVNQADQLGTSIARTLRVQSDEIRVARAQRVQEAAAKLPVKMLFPLILFIMPATFIVIAGPGVLALMKAFGR
jgi:tight adherence protein C